MVQTRRMLGSSDLVAFAASTDLARSREFYEATLGLRLVHEDGYACVFDADGTTLRVTAVAEMAAAPYTVLGWEVADIGVTIAGLAKRGVEFVRYDGMGQDERGVWTTPGGDKIAWFADPDGNVLSLTQYA
jgi:catechol 2,3-dioxygenase-like lactoylglutathione lyase family enzyme